MGVRERERRERGGHIRESVRKNESERNIVSSRSHYSLDLDLDLDLEIRREKKGISKILFFWKNEAIGPFSDIPNNPTQLLHLHPPTIFLNLSLTYLKLPF